MHRFNWVFSHHAQFLGFALGAILISVATLTPADHLPPVSGSDKLHHVIGFGGWALMCMFGPSKRFFLFLAIIIAWGGAIELIQPYVNRYGEWLDFYADAFGALLTIPLHLLMRRFCQRGIDTA